MRGEVNVSDKVEKIPLSDKQHEELLMFAENTLQDIRDMKSEQREGVTGALLLLGAVLALLEHLRQPSACIKAVLVVLVIIIGGLAIRFVRAHQDELIKFRRRLKNIYNKHFTLNLEPIIDHGVAYHDEARSFSKWGDLMLPYVIIVGAAAALSIWWIVVN